MAKLHELLAVESDLENTAKKILQETKRTFKDKAGLFIKQIRETRMYDENEQNPPTETHEMTTTVYDRLDYTLKPFIKYLDAVGQKEKTNQIAKADLTIGGTVIAHDVPATLLLGLETRLKWIRDIFDSIPTLPSGGKWEYDSAEGDHVYYNANPETRIKTAKTFMHKVLYEATEHHPAQIEKWEETKNIGEIIIKTWSGMISSKEKADLIRKVDNIIVAVKKARQRANSTEVEKINIGKAIFDYILK